MSISLAGDERPRVHVLASESEVIANLALQIEHSQPSVAAMLFDELDRAELYDEASLPSDAVTIGSQIDFVDERSLQLRRVTLVLPGEANIAEGRISVLTPMGAALYGLKQGRSINWPVLDGTERRITIMRVRQPRSEPTQ